MKNLNVKLKELVNNKYLLKEGESLIKISPNCSFAIGTKYPEKFIQIEVVEGTLFSLQQSTEIEESVYNYTYIGQDGNQHSETISYNKKHWTITNNSLYSGKNAYYCFTDTQPAIIKVSNRNIIDFFSRYLLAEYIIDPGNFTLSSENTITTNIYKHVIGNDTYYIELDEPFLTFNLSKYPTYPLIEILDDKIFDYFGVSRDYVTYCYKIISSNNLISNINNLSYFDKDGFNLSSVDGSSQDFILINRNDNDFQEHYYYNGENYYEYDTKTTINGATSFNIKRYYTSYPETVTETEHYYYISTTTVDEDSYYKYTGTVSGSSYIYLFNINCNNKQIGYLKNLRTFGSQTNPIQTFNFNFEDENNGLDSEHLPNIRSIHFVPRDRKIDIRCYGRLINNRLNLGFQVNSNVYGDVEDLIAEFVKNGRTEIFSITANAVITYKGTPIGYAKTARFRYDLEEGTFVRFE